MSAPAMGGTTVGGGANPNAAAIASLDAKIATESQTLGPNHPEIEDLRKQRAALAATPAAEAPRYVSGPSHSSLLAEQSAKVLSEQGKVGEAKRLQADVDALIAQYQSMAAREAALRQEMNGNSFSILMLDSASPPDSPTWPKIPLVLIGSFAFGFFAGVLIALIVEFMRRRVRGVEDLVSASNVPVIGVINAPPVALAA
jgi:polysaccharide biosynthesis transport protein